MPDYNLLFTAVQNFGALGILGLMVFKSPAIISAISAMIDRNIAAIRETQSEALNVFKAENDKVIGLMDQRFQAVERTLVATCEAVTELVSEMKTINERVGDLESDKPS